MGDLLGFEGYLNESTPFSLKEHKALWKSSRRYLDFDFGNDYLDKCEYPRFWLETGEPVGKDVTERMVGCYDSEFDQVRLRHGKEGLSNHVFVWTACHPPVC
jgi:alpha-1,3-glucan synthase